MCTGMDMRCDKLDDEAWYELLQVFNMCTKDGDVYINNIWNGTCHLSVIAGTAISVHCRVDKSLQLRKSHLRVTWLT